MADKSEKITQLSEAQQPFSQYPESMNNVFKENDVTISAFPVFLHPDLKEPNFPDIKIVSMDQLEDLLKRELEFWQDPIWSNKIRDWSIVDK